MKRPLKPVRLSQHAHQRLGSRGAKESEVVEAIRTVPWQPAELGRLECRKVFRYERVWHGRRYRTKEVRPVFVDESSEIVVVTVYVYYA